MSDIIDYEEVDKDTVAPEALEQLFSRPYQLLTEKAVSLKKSYINKLTGTKSLKLAVTLLDNSIEVYELTTSLSKVCRLSGHSKSIGDVVFDQKEDHLLYSTGQDGCVKLWDTRTSGSCVHEYVEQDGAQTKPFDCMDISCNGRILCAGSLTVQDDAYLVFWDQRQPQAALGGYWNSHTDDITQVRFHKHKASILATGSVDGLLNVFNIMESEEDDALLYSLNVENSVGKISWLDDSRMSCVTQSNDLQIWDCDSGDLLSSFSRDKVAKSIKRSKGDDCYLVDTFMSSEGSPVLLAGSNGGDGECLRSVTIAHRKLSPSTQFRENKQIVRCCWYDSQRDLLVTAGEGGIISAWSGGGDAPAPRNGAATKLTKSLNKLHVNRHRPY